VAAVEQAPTRFTKKWQLRCPAVVDSLKEAGDELSAFLRLPSSQWKALRTTDEIDKHFLTEVIFLGQETTKRLKTHGRRAGPPPRAGPAQAARRRSPELRS
jgi:transposase-like protein